MFNERPIDDAALQAALNEVKAIFAKYGLAGAAMLVSAGESAWTYGLPTAWSAFTADPRTPLGFRIRASLEADGEEGRHRKLEGAAHIICSLEDFGAMTEQWMGELRGALERTGLAIEHERPVWPSVGFPDGNKSGPTRG